MAVAKVTVLALVAVCVAVLASAGHVEAAPSAQAVGMAKGVQEQLAALAGAESVSAEDVSVVAGLAAKLTAQLEEETARPYSVWQVVDVLMEFTYGELICTGTCVWKAVSPVFDAAAAVAQPLLDTAWRLATTAATHASDTIAAASSHGAGLYAKHGEPVVGEHVVKLQGLAATASARVVDSIKATREAGIKMLVDRDPANAVFAEVAVDAFIVSQGGLLAIVVGWIVARAALSLLGSALCCLCSKRTTKRQHRLRTRVTTAKARQQQQQQGQQQGAKKKKAKKAKKAKAAAAPRDESDDDDEELDLSQFAHQNKKRRR